MTVRKRPEQRANPWLDGSGLRYSVDGYANQFSDWRNSAAPADPVTLNESGGSDVAACLK